MPLDSPPDVAEPPQQASPSSIGVIVADDQAVARMGTRHLLQDASDIEVWATAATQSEALRLVRTHEPNLLITEAKLPDGLGTDIPRHLRETEVSTEVLILSAYQQQVYLKSFLDTGAAGYVLKCDDAVRLVDAVRGIENGDLGWFSRSVASQLLSLRRSEGPDDREALTPRETELLEVLAQGLPNREIAAKLDLSVGTVKNYLTDIYDKLDVAGRAKAIVWAYEHGVAT